MIIGRLLPILRFFLVNFMEMLKYRSFSCGLQDQTRHSKMSSVV